MSVSEKGLEFVARFEGYRARAYADVGGVPTIGYGHVLHAAPLTAKDRLLWWSHAKALRVLRNDAAKADYAVTEYARKDLKQHEHDALVSFTFNCGVGALMHSTLLTDVNRRASGAVIRADFLRWTHAGGNVLPGLVRRRQAEGGLYVTGKYR